MRLALRSMPALLIAALLALPGISSEGGEGASGVWILPIPKFVGTSAITSGSGAGLCQSMAPSSGDLTLTTPTELGSFTALLIDEVSGSPLALPVAGRNVTLTRAVLQGLQSSGTTTAHIVIADSSQLGYVLKLTVDPASGGATLTLR